jgi:hypothetical protein
VFLRGRNPSSAVSRVHSNIPTKESMPRRGVVHSERDFIDLEFFVPVNTDWCQVSGGHEFTLNGGRPFKARHSFVCAQKDEVLGHLTSTFITNDRPKKILPKVRQKEKIEKQPLLPHRPATIFWTKINCGTCSNCGMRHLALASGDPRQVAERYSTRHEQPPSHPESKSSYHPAIQTTDRKQCCVKVALPPTSD